MDTATSLVGDTIDLTKRKIRTGGHDLNAWLAKHLVQQVVEHPEDNHLIFTYELNADAVWDVEGSAGPAALQRVRMEIRYVPRWLKGKIEINAERGLYDHVTTHLAVAPRSQFSIEIGDIKWKPVSAQNPRPRFCLSVLLDSC